MIQQAAKPPTGMLEIQLPYSAGQVHADEPAGGQGAELDGARAGADAGLGDGLPGVSGAPRGHHRHSWLVGPQPPQTL